MTLIETRTKVKKCFCDELLGAEGVLTLTLTLVEKPGWVILWQPAAVGLQAKVRHVLIPLHWLRAFDLTLRQFVTLISFGQSASSTLYFHPLKISCLTDKCYVVEVLALKLKKLYKPNKF